MIKPVRNVKAKLIEDQKYYLLRSKKFWMMFLPAIPVSIIFNLFEASLWVISGFVVLYIGLIIYDYLNQKRMRKYSENKMVEMDAEEIRITTKKGEVVEAVHLSKLEKIILKDDYSMPMENLKDIGQELTGNYKQNYVMLQRGGQQKRWDFEVDSYYMFNQLKKLIGEWEMRGFWVEYLNEIKA